MDIGSKRVARSLRLIAYLRTHPDARVPQIAFEFNVSRRTVFRDINLLCGAGVDVAWIPETGRYRVVMPPGFDQLPVLDRSELVALLAAAHESRLYKDPIVGPLARRAMIRLMENQEDELQAEMGRLLYRLEKLDREGLTTIRTVLNADLHAKKRHRKLQFPPKNTGNRRPRQPK